MAVPIAAPASGAPTAAPMIAPVAAPMPAPPRVPSSRVESGVPEHPATRQSAARANEPVAMACLRIVVLRPLFGFTLILQLLNLLLLVLDLLLLRSNLRLSLSVGVFLILHLVADRVPAKRADAAADCGTRQRVTDSGAYDRAGCGSHAGADERAFLTCRERLSRASHDHHERNRHEQTFNQRRRICPHELSSFPSEQFSYLRTAAAFYPAIRRRVSLSAASFLPSARAINRFEH